MRLINWGVKQPGQWNPLLPMAYQDQFFVRFSGLSSRREELLKENNTAERATRLERTGTTMNPNGQYLPPIPPLSKGKQALDTLIGDLERDEDGELVLEENDIAQRLMQYLRDEQVEPQKPELYYGVLGLNGLETLMAAELWNNNDHPAHAGNMRGGGKNFWLNWCQNGGRNGDSMPFSIWLHPDDFAYIRDNEDEGFGLLGSLINAEIVIDGSDTGEKFMMHLWPWNQHAQVVMQRVNDRIADESDYWEDEAEAKEGMQSIMGEEWVRYARTNAQTRGKVEGLIRPEVEWKP
tara:strand:+ start:1910 stop:2788 length:879 start_codon:yes stop_codon:yes gene_type:complete